MPRLIIAVVYLTALVLSLFAYRGWAKHLRKGLPAWRSFVGITSIFIVLFSWSVLVLTGIVAIMWSVSVSLGLVPHRWVDASLGSFWMEVVMFALLLQIPLALALKSRPRLYTTVASLLMATVYVFLLYWPM